MRTDLDGLEPETPITCTTLHAVVPARCCVLRQAVSDAQRTAQGSRGQGGDFPTCTERCVEGAAVREALGAFRRWRGVGPGGRWLRERYRGR